MKKQKARRAIEAALKALEALERAIKDENRRKAESEPWNARRQLLALHLMLEKEKD